MEYVHRRAMNLVKGVKYKSGGNWKYKFGGTGIV